MAAKPGQKTLYAECDEAFHEAVQAWQETHDKATMRQAVLGGVKLFLALPDALQGILMACHREAPIIRQIGQMITDSTVTIRLADGEPPSPGDTKPSEIVRTAATRSAAQKQKNGRR